MTFGVAEYNEGEDLGKTISRADTALLPAREGAETRWSLCGCAANRCFHVEKAGRRSHRGRI
jgi:hypothetical protein